MTTLELSEVIEHFTHAIFDLAIPAVLLLFVGALRRGWDRFVDRMRGSERR